MIYVTGDMHGDLERFKTKEIRRLKKGDTLIVCGDFGFVWDGSERERKTLQWIGKRRFTTLFVEGTHDNLDLLAAYPEQEYQGGRVHAISGNLYHLCRGSLFTIEGKRIFAFGGGESTDIDIRVEGESWWRQELPARQELLDAKALLQAHDNQVDCLITQESPARIRNFLLMGQGRINPLNAFFDTLADTLTYRQWYFGSYHLDKRIPPKQYALFRTIVPME